MSGFVSLVGAGPGDPELLTLKAARALRAADLVLYDALVSPEVLALAPDAQRFSVGKRRGRAAMQQETIQLLMIRAARRGKRVVRLKGGDPFVFGRGGEEALALAAAGIPFEVVPGISNAIAAPALAGIPLTHRGVASAFVVLSGHAEAALRPVLEGLHPGTATVVVLMGLETRGKLAEVLVGRGWPGTTPAAIVFAASRHGQRTWKGRLADLATAEVPAAGTGAAGTIVVGEVVSLAETIAAAVPASFATAPAPAARKDGTHARA